MSCAVIIILNIQNTLRICFMNEKYGSEILNLFRNKQARKLSSESSEKPHFVQVLMLSFEYRPLHLQNRNNNTHPSHLLQILNDPVTKAYQHCQAQKRHAPFVIIATDHVKYPLSPYELQPTRLICSSSKKTPEKNLMKILSDTFVLNTQTSRNLLAANMSSNSLCGDRP